MSKSKEIAEFFFISIEVFTADVARSNLCEIMDSFTVQKATMHQVITMLATSEKVLIPGRNHLLTTGTDDPTHLIITQAPASEGSSVLVVSRWS